MHFQKPLILIVVNQSIQSTEKDGKYVPGNSERSERLILQTSEVYSTAVLMYCSNYQYLHFSFNYLLNCLTYQRSPSLEWLHQDLSYCNNCIDVTNFVCFFGRLCITWTILPGGCSSSRSSVEADGQSTDPLEHSVSAAALVSNRSNIWLLHGTKELTTLH